MANLGFIDPLQELIQEAQQDFDAERKNKRKTRNKKKAARRKLKKKSNG